MGEGKSPNPIHLELRQSSRFIDQDRMNDQVFVPAPINSTVGFRLLQELALRGDSSIPCTESRRRSPADDMRVLVPTTTAEGIPDQYADGKAAKVWEYYIGGRRERTDVYRTWISQLLKGKNCKRVLDVACGTGIDSVMLLEEGFEVVSVDASDKMIMQAFRERWSRRKEKCFDTWEIDVGNWLTLPDDLPSQEGTFDAVICLGNSFANLPDFEGNLSNQKLALKNFADFLRPGGIMIIDHRNYDAILDTGRAPVQNIYYKGNCIKDIQTSTLYVNGRPSMVTLDYFIDICSAKEDIKNNSQTLPKKKLDIDPANPIMKFRLSYYPHRLNAFTELLKEAFGSDCKHELLADWKPESEVTNPAYYIHTVQKPF